MTIENFLNSSFRDPSGFLYFENEILYRSVNHVYRDNYDHLISSGLYDHLADANLLIPHEETPVSENLGKEIYKILKPEIIPFISYPYEWCFEELKDAALATLEVQKRALKHGMSLKDASAYNIQFRKGNPVLIDTLSFEKYREGSPWIAYRQFCQHFLAPLALMSYKDTRLGLALRNHIDGLPLDLASSILPFRSKLKFPIFSHIHLHAKSQRHFARKRINVKEAKISQLAFRGLIDSLESCIKKLKIKYRDIEGWAEYYDITNYTDEGLKHKQALISDYLDACGKPGMLWDLGANTGVFSRIAADKGFTAISFDYEHDAVNANYLRCKKEGRKNLVPLVLDLTNPSPSTGWANRERFSLAERGPADVVMALALLHHLAISNNVPFKRIAEFFSAICGHLIVEFVPKEDSQVQILLSTREDVFADYTKDNFETDFGKYFLIEKSQKIKDSQRTLYLMKRK